jgi:transposase-like protein
MQQGLSPRQVESERVPRERLQVQRAELRMELHRLKSAECYGEPRLLQLLQECMRACRG